LRRSGEVEELVDLVREVDAAARDLLQVSPSLRAERGQPLAAFGAAPRRATLQEAGEMRGILDGAAAARPSVIASAPRSSPLPALFMRASPRFAMSVSTPSRARLIESSAMGPGSSLTEARLHARWHSLHAGWTTGESHDVLAAL
jgi:hypothetical protein